MKLHKLLFLALIWILALPAAGLCFDVTARVDKNKMTPEDSLLLQVQINGGKAELDLSMIKDFKVMPRGTTSSYQFINGKSESTFSYQFALIPLAKGDLKIPPIKASRDGETAFTKEIDIAVSESLAVPGDEVKDLFARADVTAEKLFMGQTGLYSLKFYTSKRISSLGFENPPEFKGFLAKPLEKEKNYTETIGGILYQVTEVNYSLSPTKSGIFTIQPSVFIANVLVKSNRNTGLPSFFNDPFFSSDSTKSVRVASNPVTMEVRPLPPYKGKNPFSGLVGRFKIEAAMDKISLKAGESATLSISISGSGNIMDASPPAIDMDQNAFKTYDDNPVETINLTEKGYEGEKVFKKAVVPVNPGKYTIPPVILVYFDVKEEAYKEISTLKISFSVAPSGEVQVTDTPNGGAPLGNTPVMKKEVALVNQDIFEIKEGLSVLTPYREISPFLFTVLILFPAFLFSGVRIIVLVRKKEDPIGKIMQEKARRHFKEAEKMNANDKDFSGRLYSSLVAGVFSRAQKKGETLTLDEARSILMQTGADKNLMDDVTGLLEKIESARFGGKTMDEKEGKMLLSEVGRVIRLLCFAIFCVGLFSFSPQKAMADPGADFINTVQQYKTGKFSEAAKGFESLASGSIKNPYLYYNTGNAYLKAGDLGRAILWYERAKYLLPNDPDLNFNLDYAMGLVKDKNESSPEIMDILFFWDRLFPARVIQGSAVFFSFVFFAWASIRAIKNKKIFSGTGIMLCVIFFLVTMMAMVQYQQKAFRPNAVIVQDEVSVRSGITDTSTKLFSLHAGTKVSVEEERQGYLKIRFSKDRVGWVKAADAIVI